MTHEPHADGAPDTDRAHDRYEELVALALYDELEPAERRVLEHHLTGCATCRALERELAGTLGVLRASGTAPAETDLPADWSERLRAGLEATPRTEPRAAHRRTALAFVAGLAAGLALTVGLLGWRATTPAPGGRRPTLAPPANDAPEATALVARGPRTAPFLARSAPPPRATSQGPLAVLRAAGRR